MKIDAVMLAFCVTYLFQYLKQSAEIPKHFPKIKNNTFNNVSHTCRPDQHAFVSNFNGLFPMPITSQNKVSHVYGSGPRLVATHRRGKPGVAPWVNSSRAAQLLLRTHTLFLCAESLFQRIKE